MNNMKEFLRKRSVIQEEIGRDMFRFDESEFWMIRATYEYIECYAMKNNLMNTAIALSLARGLHNGVHRKSSIVKDGTSFRLPYVIHPLQVCRMLVNLRVPIPKEEEDILLAAALCHDMIEDVDFPNHGTELYTDYHLHKKVYETVKLVSKRRDFTEEEEAEFFHQIETHPLALLVKLSDRGNNVEDLYNMKVWKVHEYVEETRKWFLPMCIYGKTHYPELLTTFEILEEKITTLTVAAEILTDRYDTMEKGLLNEIAELEEENARLHDRWDQLMEK